MGSCSQSDVVKKVVRHYYNSDLKFSLSEKEREHFTWKEQEEFLSATLNCELLETYPVSKEFSRLFIKKIIEMLEAKQEVHDDFYNHLCSVMKGDGDHFYYKHYIIGGNVNNIITMKETKNLVVNGTTGLKTWQAAVMLADWALVNKEEFENKIILELGSGIGFTGVTISKLCNVKSYIFTDCHEDVLRTINSNIDINFSDAQRKDVDNKTIYRYKSKELEVLKLDWNNMSDIPNDLVPDVLIGADIIYDPTIVNPLCNVVRHFLTRNRSLHIYLMNIMRNKETFKLFLNELDIMDLSYEYLKFSNSVNIDWDESIDKYFLRIKISNKTC